MFKSLVPMLHTKEMDKTISFYEDVLGFHCVGRFENDWCRLEREGVAIMFFEVDEFDKPNATATQYFYVDRLNEFWNDIKDRVVAEWGPQEMHYGMYEVGIKDPNGYLLSFGEELAS
ncbi:MAG: bleomycin resistance family protein [Rhodomicrobium sp.]|nr:MAG: bleomycin resistance family protein [Rhodomicrobium sp.]